MTQHTQTRAPRGNRILQGALCLIGLGVASLSLRTCSVSAAPSQLVAPVSVTASSTQDVKPDKIIDGSGFKAGANPGEGTHGSDKYADGGAIWNSNYVGGAADTNASLTFDFGKAVNIGSFRVWNNNEDVNGNDNTGRGFKEVEISTSPDNQTFSPVTTLTFDKATGTNDYTGQLLSLPKVVNTRYLRFKANSNWRGGDVSGLSEVRFFSGLSAATGTGTATTANINTQGTGGALAAGQQVTLGGRSFTVESVQGNRVVLLAGAATGNGGATGGGATNTAPVAATGTRLGNTLAPVSVVASSSQACDPRRIIDGSGLQETADGSGVFEHSTDKFAGGGTMWNANYVDGKVDANATLLFDMGKEISATGVHIWNYNEKRDNYNGLGRGVRDVEVLAGSSPDALTSIGTYSFPEAIGQGDTGSEVPFKAPATARYFKFVVQTTWLGNDVPGLSEVRFLIPGGAAPATKATKPVAKYARPTHPKLALGQALAGAENIVFPADAGLVDVTKAPYGAKGDGVSDDTAAIQKALQDYPNKGAIIYLPNGVYVISDTLRWGKTDDGNSEKNEILQGQSRDGTIIKLKDAAPGYGNKRAPKSMAYTGAAPAQRFRNSVRNVTFDTGVGNPGAIGLQFNASNQGTVHDVSIVSGDGSGPIGLDMSFTNEIGPLLVKNLRVRGFDTGIKCGGSVNSMTFEHVAVQDQNVVGVRNEGQTVTMRDYRSTNAVPAFDNDSGFVTLVGATLTGRGAASDKPAIINSADLYARGVKATGYTQAINGAAVKGLSLVEYSSKPVAKLFDSPAGALNLPVKETPEVPWDNLNDWASPAQFGGKPNDNQDDSEAIQKAIDSGKTTVYLPNGNWNINHTVLVRGKVRRIIGCEAAVDIAGMDTPGFKVVDGAAPVVVIERLIGGYAKTTSVENASSRTLVMANLCNFNGHMSGSGDVFIEDVTSNPFHGWQFSKQNIWARQFNPENEGTHVQNDGGKLWILGLKTERGGTLVETKGGGQTEVVGGFSYTTTAGKLAPMFVVDNARASFSFREVCFNGDPFTTIVRETRGGQTKIVAGTDPAWGSTFTLYSGHDE